MPGRSVDWLQRRVDSWSTLVAWVAGCFVVVLAGAIAGGLLLRLWEGPDGSTGVDRRVTDRVVAHRSDALTSLAHALARIGSTSVLLPLVALTAGLLAWRRRFVPAGVVIVTWGGSIGLYNLTKLVVDRPRPPPGIRIGSAAGSSFPSGHATQSLATYVVFAVVLAAIWRPARFGAGIPAALLILGVGWSRVYLGLHWATDVVAGWLIGGAWVVLMILLIGPVTDLVPTSHPPPRSGDASP
jgi:undecaprenyl-diphosphatase